MDRERGREGTVGFTHACSIRSNKGRLGLHVVRG